MFYYLIALQNYKYYVMLSDDDNISIDTLPSHNICDWLLINRPLRIEKVIKYLSYTALFAYVLSIISFIFIGIRN